MSRTYCSETGVKRELKIVWLRDPANYDYLREGVMWCHYRDKFPLKGSDPAKCTDGGPLAHIVAYAVLKPDAPSDSRHMWERRYWWVKEYDRFVGRSTHSKYKDTYEDPDSAPCEAVAIDSIIAGCLTEPFEPGERMMAN